MRSNEVAARLGGFGVFDQSVIESVARTAGVQDYRSFGELADNYDIQDGPARVLPIGSKMPIDVVHLSPIRRGVRPINYDSSRARVLFSPFGVGVNTSMAMRAMRLYGADPREQLLLIGGPSIPGQGAGKVALRSLPEVWRGNLQPLVEPTLRYLGEMGVESATFLGYSHGADLAVAASRYSHNFDIGTCTAVVAESAGMQSRSMAGLARSFFESGAKLDEYINAADSASLNEARQRMGGNAALYVAGLMRATNIAAARSISRGIVLEDLSIALSAQPKMNATIAYGTQSELIDGTQARQQIENIKSHYLGRVASLAIPGMHHAGGDDINLHAAIMLQGLYNGSKTVN